MAVPEFLQRFSVIWLAHIGPDDWALESGLHSRTPWRVFEFSLHQISYTLLKMMGWAVNSQTYLEFLGEVQKLSKNNFFSTNL